MGFNKPTGYANKLKFIQIDMQFCEKMETWQVRNFFCVCVKNLRVMSSFNVFARQNGLSAGRTNTTHYIDPNDIHMDKKKKNQTILMHSNGLNTDFI